MPKSILIAWAKLHVFCINVMILAVAGVTAGMTDSSVNTTAPALNQSGNISQTCSMGNINEVMIANGSVNIVFCVVVYALVFSCMSLNNILGNEDTEFLRKLKDFLSWFIFFGIYVSYLLSLCVFGLNLSAIIKPFLNDSCDLTSTFESSIAFSIVMTLLAAVIICMPCIFGISSCCIHCKFCTCNRCKLVDL